MKTFETEVHIRRPIDEVFDYVSNPLNFPRWSSAVVKVRPLASPAGEVSSTYVMERELPGGRAENQFAIVTSERPREFLVRSTSGPTPFVYRYLFWAVDGETDVALVGAFGTAGMPPLAAPLAAQAVKRGVDDNLANLKKLLEG
jgi:uncharacterized protein YndB with AHSA1/START domain